MKARFKPHIPKDQFKSFEKEFNRRKPAIEKKMRSYGYRTIKGWKSRVGFKVSTRLTRGSIRTTAEPTGPFAWLWDMLDAGTKKHIIRPVKAKALRFQGGKYTPKTQPGGQYGGPGTSSGGTVYAQVVHHPGTKPRRFRQEWIRWAREWYPDEIQSIVNATVR